MTISQKEGVYSCVVAVLKEKGESVEPGVKVELATSERKMCVAMLCEATEAGDLEVKSEKARSNLPKYWDGTLSNWLRKDTRLNGGEPYKTKSPGSRAGSQDPEIREMRKMLKHPDYAAHKVQIQAAIDAKLAEIAASKAKDVEIDTSVISPKLLAKLGA